MDTICTYQITVAGGVDEQAFNRTSPLQMQVVRARSGATHLRATCDQAGLIGLLRHLHQQGYVLRSVTRGPVVDSKEADHVYPTLAG